eukprot:6476676-Amphidinium_carterae.3
MARVVVVPRMLLPMWWHMCWVNMMAVARAHCMVRWAVGGSVCSGVVLVCVVVILMGALCVWNRVACVTAVT